MRNRKYGSLDDNLLTIILNKFNEHLINKKNKKFKDKRNIKKIIGRPRKIDIKHVIICAFKIINGSLLEDLLKNPKEQSSYEKYIRELKTSGILDVIFKNKIINLKNNNELDMSSIHIDSTDLLNINGYEDISYGHKFKNKKASRLHMSISNNNIPLSFHLTGANISDTTQLKQTLDNIPFKLNSSNKKPTYVMVDKGYYSKKNFYVIENDHKCKMLCPLKKNANLKEDHNKEMFNRFKRKCNR